MKVIISRQKYVKVYFSIVSKGREGKRKRTGMRERRERYKDHTQNLRQILSIHKIKIHVSNRH